MNRTRKTSTHAIVRQLQNDYKEGKEIYLDDYRMSVLADRFVGRGAGVFDKELNDWICDMFYQNDEYVVDVAFIAGDRVVGRDYFQVATVDAYEGIDYILNAIKLCIVKPDRYELCY